jgi:glyoxylase-like metal-dependent hydrolase (beta-lactamase superfamily II)
LMGRITRSCGGAETAIHQDACAVIEGIAQNRQARAARTENQLRTNGVPEKELSAFTKMHDAVRNTIEYLDLPDITLQGGETISTGLFDFKVIWTPGHAPGHICLYDSGKEILLSGDHVLPEITPNISMTSQTEENPLGLYFDSLREIDKLDVALVLPGHDNVFEDLHERIEGIISHHGARLDHALEAIQEGAKTAYEIAADMPWMAEAQTDEGVSFADMDPMSRGLATGETMAHLEYLRFECKVKTESNNGKLLYRRVVD